MNIRVWDVGTQELAINETGKVVKSCNPGNRRTEAAPVHGPMDSTDKAFMVSHAGQDGLGAKNAWVRSSAS